MAKLQRPCSECDNLLPEDASPVQKSCSPACRAKRSRRMKRQAKERGSHSPHSPAQQVMAAANREGKEVAREVMAEELRPIIREAITEDVLKAVKDLVGLTPALVAAIEHDVTSPTVDAEIRQRAYTLLAKYTLGNPSVMPKSAEAQPAPMQVVFNMPRPGDSTSADDAPVESIAVELRDCSECGETKPLQDFVAASTRCQVCHDELQAKVAARFP